MNPNIIQYKQAIDDSDSFKKLKNSIAPIMNGREPYFVSGNFAVVFKMIYKGKNFALKCFLKDIPERKIRQKKIIDFVSENKASYLIEHEYLENELWVDNNPSKGKEYDVSWMPWIEAPTLGEKIKDLCSKNDLIGLKELSDVFKVFSVWLLKQPFAHGDLKHDNILVKENNSLVLIDYDGMFVPELSGKPNYELGGPDYQHPKRDGYFFNKSLDDFSILIIHISLLALSLDSSLYQEYNNGQNIIFNKKDFLSFKNSELISRLNKYPEMSVFIKILKDSLENNDLIITNLIRVISGDISQEDFLKEIRKTSELIDNNYSILQKKYNSGSDIETIIGIVETQRLFTQNYFQAYEQQQEIIEAKQLLKEQKSWWKRLPKLWKISFMFNVDFHQYINNIRQDSDVVYLNRIEDKYFSQKIKTNIIIKDKTLLKIIELDQFFLSQDCLATLSPISNLKKMQRLFIINNTLDLKPILKLNLLNQITLKHNKFSLNSLKAYLDELKKNGGSINISTDK